MKSDIKTMSRIRIKQQLVTRKNFDSSEVYQTGMHIQ